MCSDVLFKKKDGEFFKQFITKIKFESIDKIGSDELLRKAIVCGYLDVCRTPLSGIGHYIKKPDTSITVRDKFVSNRFINMIIDLSDDEKDYDEWHEELSDAIQSYYSNYGYKVFTYGKTQKWINMTMKYILLYHPEYSDKLKKYNNLFHVPIDRYIAPAIAGMIHYLPKDIEDRKFETLDASFNPDKENYCWSKINDYNDYLECQIKLRDTLATEGLAPLRWEFDEWKKQKLLKVKCK